MAYRSRLSRYKVKRERQQTVVYLLLSVAFVFLVIRFGVPGFIQLVSWWTGRDADKQEVELDIPPQAPVLGELPEATFSAQIKIEGWAQTGNRVKLVLNEVEVDETVVTGDGRFSFDQVRLDEGENRLRLTAVDPKDRDSQAVTAVVVFDKVAPVLTISEPVEEVQRQGVAEQYLTIKGQVDDSQAEVRVNDGFVLVSGDGAFEYRVRLSEGVNELVVVAVDVAGNRAEQLVRAVWTE